jgi:hypothetical protein
MNPIVERCKTEKECLVLAGNAQRKGRTDISYNHLKIN